MSHDNDLIAAAIMANKVAWSSLLGALVTQGSVDPHTVDNDLRHMQQAFRDSGNHAIADALELHLEAVEGWLPNGGER
ncbi:hypothetical protein H8I91_21450 [Serratia fonticola]|uniref:hypothetical protein n=1 Tax=Serratia fonticola TaxID=47917 RepID=UPI001647E93E|nr:hypothetical protein [Serratia fonticola]MBC3252834.1 hypothetical protein [Serratia fonticola]